MGKDHERSKITSLCRAYCREDIPFKYFIQSPIGLVPKSNGQTRLIFHLSYNFPNGEKSVNFYTPQELCTVKYKNLDFAVRMCLELQERCPGCQFWLGISDLKSAFRILPTNRESWPLLMTSVVNPSNGNRYYFLDKNLPFGASISCALFQRFSNSLAHIVYFMGRRLANIRLINYLDDFLCISTDRHTCNQLVRTLSGLAMLWGYP